MSKDPVIEIMKKHRDCMFLPHDVVENIISSTHASIISDCISERGNTTNDAGVTIGVVSAIYRAIAKGEKKASIGIINNDDCFKEIDVDFFTYWDDIIDLLKNKGYKVETMKTGDIMLTIFISWE